MAPSIQVSDRQSPGKSSTMNGAEVLLVDDDQQVRRVLRMTLMSAGYTVFEARTGEEALEKVQADGAGDMILLISGCQALEGSRPAAEFVQSLMFRFW